jgi:type I restriction enzyme S subunit
MKKTKAGMIPVDWEVVRLGDVAEIQTGIAKNQKIEQNTVELPYLRVANVQDGYLDLSEIKTIKIPRSKLDRYKLRKDDILLTEGGDFDKLGRGAVWHGEIEDCVHQNHVFVVRTNPNRILPLYLSNLTSSFYGKKYFLTCSKQSTNLASINSTQLKAFPVIYSSLEEQKAIVNLLSIWDEAIETTERLIKAKERRSKWLLRELISEPPNSRKGTKWKKVKLGEVCEISKKEKLASVEKCFLLTVKLHCLGIERNDRIVPKLTERGRPYFQHYAGDFLIGRQNFHNGGFGIIPSELDGGITSNAISTLIVNESKLSKTFLWYQFSNFNYYKKVGHVMDGTGQKELSDKQILKLPIILPPIEEQTLIAERLSNAQQEIDLLKQLADKYRIQKRGLMQKLLTGLWRVKRELI